MTRLFLTGFPPMTYSTNVAKLLTEQLNGFTKLCRPELGGQIDKREFWLSEVRHCITLLDDEALASRLEDTKSISDQLAHIRESLHDAAFGFLEQSFREGLIEVVTYQRACRAIGLEIMVSYCISCRGKIEEGEELCDICSPSSARCVICDNVLSTGRLQFVKANCLELTCKECSEGRTARHIATPGWTDEATVTHRPIEDFPFLRAMQQKKASGAIVKQQTRIPSYPARELIKRHISTCSVDLLPKKKAKRLRKAHGDMRKNRKLYVGNLPFTFTERHLKKLFAAHGKVKSAQVIINRDTGCSKGFGFVEMGSFQEAEAAISALNGKHANGRALTVNEARPLVAGGKGPSVGQSRKKGKKHG
jgi:cold-inducible RNA-binding protein